ncbi:MAG: ABC transporter permease [Hyphomicrobiaceae bacterium]|nr:ABC transporter permease [Hyphomicrobiaceae bacterium]
MAITEALPAPTRPSLARQLTRSTSVLIGGIIVAAMVMIGVLAPFLGTRDPAEINPSFRNKTPGFTATIRDDEGKKVPVVYRFGTDSLGRDIYSRVIYGARVSLVVGITVALISISIGLVIGLIAGYIRWLDGIIMRIMDGLMAIPAILLAIGLISVFRAGLLAVIIAIVVPEVPRVVRLVRSIVLSIREEPYVESAVTVGTPTPQLIVRHVLPNTIAPLIVQGTFICAAAILLEAILSFLGIGIPPEIPTWGNIMAEGRTLFRVFPHNILFPGIFLALTVFGVNMLGDGLRDVLDPKMERRF